MYVNLVRRPVPNDETDANTTAATKPASSAYSTNAAPRRHPSARCTTSFFDTARSLDYALETAHDPAAAGAATRFRR